MPGLISWDSDRDIVWICVMKMNELVRYDLPPEIICLWKDRESTALLPIQELTVKRHGLFDGGNLLIQAPTSSGKTFIGEMAAVQTALRRKKVVYLVPLKALAEEKYQDFRAKYEAYGIDVILSTRDHRRFDQQLETGDFSVAVVVYEKLAQLLVRRPERLKEIELIVADELELLSDPERGGMTELLLTRILKSNCRLIGLSAVIGDAEKLAEWMQAELVFHERRPVELRYGVLYDGTFHYRTYNEFSEAEERLVDAHSESSWEVLTQNVCTFAEQGESCLIFVKAKHESRRGAELLAQRVNRPAAPQALEALKTLEPSRSRDCLANTLNTGVAFHNADLSPDERRVVEQAFRSGEINVLVSTSTLAIGMNLPARNVFISADKWRYDNRFGMPWKAPILRSEYENMGGRAGRYGAGHAFGRSILVASTPFDRETLWRRYIEGEREPITPRLSETPLEDHVLRLVASRCCRTQKELLDFLESTLTGQWIWQQTYTLEEITFRICAAVNRAVDAGVLTSDPDGRLEATPFGQAAAAKGISIATARELEHWTNESETRAWSEIDLIFAAASTPDGRMYTVSLTTQEYDHAEYTAAIKHLTHNEPIAADVPLNRIRNCTLTPFFEEVRAIKVALFLHEWIDQTPLLDLEERFHTMTGQVLAAAEQVSWLVDATAAVATALGAPDAFTERIKTTAQRVKHGLPPEALPLARLDDPELSRSTITALFAHGLHTPEALAQTPGQVLEQWLSKKEAGKLMAWAHRSAREPGVPEAEVRPTLPVLVVDDKQPGQIVLQGAEIPLQDKQYRLIRILAEFPGECVPYETIYAAVWGDTIVENNQMHFQKRKLLQRIEGAAPNCAAVIKTVPKRGFLLNLLPEQVALRPAEITTTA